MIYTIGHQANYDQALQGMAAAGQQLYKVGRTADYPGGYAFQTAEDAQRRIAEAYPDRHFAVYEVDADWERDTYPAANGWWHHLKEDRPIIGRKENTMDDPEEEGTMTYVCDLCGREIDEAEAYIDEGVLCPDCHLNSLEDEGK